MGDGEYLDFEYEPDDEPAGGLEDNPLFGSSAEAQFLREILDQYGIEQFSDIVVDFSPDLNPSELRGNRFVTLAEAVMFLHDIGVLGFSNIVYYKEEDLYGSRIPDDTP